MKDEVSSVDNASSNAPPNQTFTNRPTERILETIWADVFKVNEVNIYEDFFELGGHSLLALQIINRVREAVGVNLPLPVLFEPSSSIKEISERIDAMGDPKYNIDD